MNPWLEADGCERREAVHVMASGAAVTLDEGRGGGLGRLAGQAPTAGSTAVSSA